MSTFLRDLLDADEPLFSKSLEGLEQASHRQGVDAKLIGVMHERMAKAIRDLGLDPADTTGQELYAALLARMANDNVRLAKKIGGQQPNNVRHMVPLIVKAAQSVKANRKCWVLKHSVAKELL